VPKTIVTAGEAQVEILGALPQNAFVEQALAPVSAATREPEHQTKS